MKTRPPVNPAMIYHDNHGYHPEAGGCFFLSVVFSEEVLYSRMFFSEKIFLGMFYEKVLNPGMFFGRFFLNVSFLKQFFILRYFFLLRVIFTYCNHNQFCPERPLKFPRLNFLRCPEQSFLVIKFHLEIFVFRIICMYNVHDMLFW